LSFWTAVAAPYLARGLGAWLASRRPRQSPGWTAAPWLGASAAALGCVALTALELSQQGLRLGIAIQPTSYPGPACDFIAPTGIGGRAFNYFEQGGYLLWRFWPDRKRLPFMTTIPELATPEMRLGYQEAMVLPEGWRALSASYRFDWVLLKCIRRPSDRYLDFLDADPEFALVFADDVSALYLRRQGPLAPLADSLGYRWFCRGRAKLDSVWARVGGDRAARAELRAEVERAVRSSPLHASAASLLASVHLLDGALAEARTALEEAHRLGPRIPRYQERLGDIALAEGQPAEAVRAFEAERGGGPESAELAVKLATAYKALGKRESAVRHLERAIALDPWRGALRDTLEA